jgi:hypothetical protein
VASRLLTAVLSCFNGKRPGAFYRDDFKRGSLGGGQHTLAGRPAVQPRGALVGRVPGALDRRGKTTTLACRATTAHASWLFHASVATLLIGLVISLPAFDIGIRIAGLALLALALWLFRYDIAGRTVREHGLPRYMAVSLLCGYFWLATAGMLWITFADDFVAGPKYDAMLHAVSWDLSFR